MNQSEIEKMAARARLNGHEIVASAAQADVVIINTCAVTQAAGADSRKKIRQAARAGHARIAATGCYVSVAPDEVSSLPEVHWQVPNCRKDDLIEDILGGVADEESEHTNARIALPGKQRRTRAFIKVQDGCDNFCTFCITRIARGKSKSQTRAEIFADIASALAGGVKEIVLTGVNLGAWGTDLEGTPTFPSLVEGIIKELAPSRLRLSSFEPWDIRDDFLEILTLPGFCRHLHLPLQSGSAGVLKRMGRRNTPEEYRQLLEKIRKAIPEIAITTDIMVGFPGESEAEFKESLEFVSAMQFAGGHVFNYSLRPGTAAAQMESRIAANTRRKRSEIMREVFKTSRKKYQNEFIGRVEGVLWERSQKVGDEWQLDGLTDNYLRVRARAGRDLWNTISDVRLESVLETDMEGMIVERV